MIPNIKATEGAGSSVLKKVIHKGSESIMFSVLQETQYVYPFKSSVREIVSNCLDSVTERNNSLKIINGEKKVEDLYIVKEGSEFSGSSFNAEYYDPLWLSDDDMVTILYIDNDTESRDRIKFIDNGVGLGGSRLINYFSLGYSSKRLSKNQLGSFGLGAKSLLATGIDFYTVTSRYNGREYSFHVYKDHVVSAIPKFNEAGTTNNEETFFPGEENEYSVFYRDTTLKNGVIIETEVKRHRKMDFISSIENQLGFIPNIELLIADANMEYIEPSKRNIATNVLFSTDKLLVGESDYYAVPQILLKPGDDSNVMISYGVINFEELEMKKYSGNVSFIMNINDVDVTPSRENVIWNTKTREAIKSMFTTAQHTVIDIVESKIKDEATLPDYLTLLAGFKDKNSISGLSELYKIIDIAKIDNTFRGFEIGAAALQLSDNDIKKDFIFTSTENLNSYGSPKISDTNFSSTLSKDYIAMLSRKNHAANVVVYIGDTKYQNLARYAADVFSLSDRNINIIYIREELYSEYHKNIAMMGIDAFMDEAYTTKNFKDVLIGEVVRYVITAKDNHLVLYNSEIDTTKMSNIAKIQEEAAGRNTYMTHAEREKSLGKAIGNLHYSFASSTRDYFDEEKVMREKLIIYPMGNKACENILTRASGSIPSGARIVGFSQDNFKRFYKLEGVRVLTDCLYTISFGDLKFTKLGECFFTQTIRNSFLDLYSRKKHSTDLQGSIFKFLEGQYKDFSINIPTFNGEVNRRVNKYTRKEMEYLAEEKPCSCKDCKTLK